MNQHRSARLLASLSRAVRLRDAALLAWFALYLLLSVEPHLIYHARSPIFLLAPDFLPPFLQTSGGPLECVSLLLAQLYAWDWAGALLLAAEAWAIGMLADACLRRIAGRPVRGARFLPVVLFMLLGGQFRQPLSAGPGLIAMLGCALIYARLPAWPRPARSAAYLALAGLLYWAAAGAFLKLNLLLTMGGFSLLCGLVERARGGRRRAGWVWLPVTMGGAAALAWVGEQQLLYTNRALWSVTAQLPMQPWLLLHLCLYLSVPAAALWLSIVPVGWAGRLRSRFRAAGAVGEPAEEPAGKRRRPAGAGSAREAARQRLAVWILQTAALVWATSALAAYAFSDQAVRRATRIDHHMVRHQWQRALDELGGLPQAERTPELQHDLNRALFETGRLGDEMFLYGQTGVAVIPLHEPERLSYLYRLAELCLYLGRVNDAEHIACEALAMHGKVPRVLQILALVHLAKEQPEAARFFLNTLDRDLVHRGWARRYLRLLQSDPQLASDPEVTRIRSVMLRSDDVWDITSWSGDADEQPVQLFDRMLADLVAENPGNRMALEYLLALCLLDGTPPRLAQLAANVRHLRAAGFTRLPRAYAEALAVYVDQTGKTPDLGGLPLPQDAIEEYRRFKQDTVGHRPGEPIGAGLVERYAGSYFLYRLLKGQAER